MSINPEKITGPVSVRAYVMGFILSVYLTLTAYALVVHHNFNERTLMLAVIGLALVQFLVQLVFFLHLGRETRPRWKFMVFLSMLLVVGILVFGSLWIMNHLNYHMTEQQTEFYLKDQDRL